MAAVPTFAHLYIINVYHEAWWSPIVDSSMNITILYETEEDMGLYLI